MDVNPCIIVSWMESGSYCSQRANAAPYSHVFGIIIIYGENFVGILRAELQVMFLHMLLFTNLCSFFFGTKI